MNKQQSNGFTLMELMVCIFILQLALAPLYMTFSGSKQMMVNARELTKAVNLASSMIASLRKLEVQTISPLSWTSEANLPAFCSLATLGLSKVQDGFQRHLMINLVDGAAAEGGPYYEATVEIKWKNQKLPGSPELQMVLKGLLGEKNP